MKKSNNNVHKKKTFLKLPTYPGGKQAFLIFVKNNLNYPKQAIENKIQGLVFVEYDVDNVGNVLNVFIKKGLGYGCDEEAIRVIKLLQYEPVRNRGVRMKTRMKTRISFELPKSEPTHKEEKLNINYITNNTTQKNKQVSDEKPAYSYTITLDFNKNKSN